MIEIGQIIKAQGIKGELKIRPMTFDVKRFNKLKEVLIDNTSFVVLKTAIREGFVYMTLDGVSDRNGAEKLKDKLLCVSGSEKITLPAHTYLIKDLVDCDVFIDGKYLGKVIEVNQFGAADVFVVQGEKKYGFPFLKDCVLNINTSEKKIELDERRFFEIAVEY